MKSTFLAIATTAALVLSGSATTIMVTPIFEPLSLHDTDGDEAISDTGEALQACVMSRPMAMTGAYPEVLIFAIRTPHQIPTNNDNYVVKEANLLELANIGIIALKVAKGLEVRLDVTHMSIPEDVDLTSRQILNLTIVAIRKTLEAYQIGQDQPLNVILKIVGTTPNNSTLKELEAEFVVNANEDGE